MARGGWDHLNKRCPQKRCDGELFAKSAGPLDGRGRMTAATHLAVKCSKGDFEKRGRTREMEAWVGRQADKRGPGED